ncbi:MAG: DUF4403 family protein, partial [Rhodothermales bacterium]|nr:DUF4403 family protein [Rhodothermales bacterium]
REPPVWLAVRPVDAFALPPESRGDTLVYGLGVRAFVETLLGEPPPHALGPLPPLRALPDSLAGDALHAFQIHFPVSIPYGDANRLLTDALAGRDLPVHDDVALRLDGVALYGSADTLVARIDFRARLAEDRFRTRGRIFLTGTPTYDPSARSIRVDGFDYDVHSQHALAEAADWFFRNDVLAQVRGRLVLPLADRLADAQARLQEALTARAVGRHILLDARIDTIAPGRLYLVEDGITLDVTARGRLTARVQALDAIGRRDSTRAPAGG